MNRLKREQKTIEVMLAIYCRAHHESEAGILCPVCSELLAYARNRLQKCPFGEHKSTCAKCPIHCYRPDMQEKMREVMRYSGPKMLLRHPGLALLHLWDGRPWVKPRLLSQDKQ